MLVAAVLLVAIVGLCFKTASAAGKDNGPPTLNVMSSCEAAASRTAIAKRSTKRPARRHDRRQASA
jgi:hypothetical protein